MCKKHTLSAVLVNLGLTINDELDTVALGGDSGGLESSANDPSELAVVGSAVSERSVLDHAVGGGTNLCQHPVAETSVDFLHLPLAEPDGEGSGSGVLPGDLEGLATVGSRG